MFYFKLLLLAAASKEEKIKLAPEQTAFGTLMPKVWLHCPVCPCGYGQAQLSAVLVGSYSMDLLSPTTSACCSTHTTSRGRCRAGGVHRRGWELLFLSRWLLHLCALGAAQLYGRGFSGVYIILQ